MSTYDELVQMNSQIAAPLSQDEEQAATDTVVIDEMGLESIIARIGAVSASVESIASRNKFMPSVESMKNEHLASSLEGRLDDYMSRGVTAIVTFLRRIYQQIMRLINSVRFRKQTEKENASFEILTKRARSMNANLAWDEKDKEYAQKYGTKINSISSRVKEAVAEHKGTATKLQLMLDLEKLTGGKTYGADAAKRFTAIVNNIYRGGVSSFDFNKARKEVADLDGVQDDVSERMFEIVEGLVAVPGDINLNIQSGQDLVKITNEYEQGRKKHRAVLQKLIAQAEKRAGALADPAIDKAYVALQQARVNMKLSFAGGEAMKFMKEQAKIFAALSNVARIEKLYIDSVIQADRVFGGWLVPSEGGKLTDNDAKPSTGKHDGVIDGSDIVDKNGNTI